VPDGETLHLTMPIHFANFLSDVIIDCSEIFIECPSDLLARAQVWSNNKHGRLRLLHLVQARRQARKRRPDQLAPSQRQSQSTTHDPTDVLPGVYSNYSSQGQTMDTSRYRDPKNSSLHFAWTEECKWPEIPTIPATSIGTLFARWLLVRAT